MARSGTQTDASAVIEMLATNMGFWLLGQQAPDVTAEGSAAAAGLDVTLARLAEANLEAGGGAAEELVGRIKGSVGRRFSFLKYFSLLIFCFFFFVFFWHFSFVILGIVSSRV